MRMASMLALITIVALALPVQSALAADEGVKGPGPRKQAPPRWRIFALFIAGVVMALMLYAFTRQMLEATR
jgi:hypothetical protein